MKHSFSLGVVVLVLAAFGACEPEGSTTARSRPGDGPGSGDAGGTPDAPWGDAGTDAPVTTGTRLRPNVLEGPGGASMHQGFYDSELQQECEFVRTSTDADRQTYHCIADTSAELVFSDADCTVRLAVNIDACSTPSEGDVVRVFRPSEDGCTTEPEFYTVQASTTIGSAYMLRWPDGSCQPATHIAAGTAAHELTPVDLSRFVRGTLQVGGATGGLQTASIVGDDGSQVFSHFRYNGVSCSVDEVGGAGFVCVDGSLAIDDGSLYETESCEGQTLVQATVDACSAAPTWAKRVSRGADGCETLEGFSTLGEERGVAYLKLPDACEMQMATDERPFLVVGADVPLDGFGKLALTQQGERLQAEYLGAADGPGVMPWRWFDTELGVPCYPTETPDETMRCLPAALPTTTQQYFKDTACMQSLDVVTSEACPPPMTDPLFVIEYSTDACLAAVAAMVELSEYTGAVYVPDAEGGCSELPNASELGLLFYERGTNVDLSQYVELTARTL